MSIITHPIRLIGAFGLIAISVILSLLRERRPVLTRDRLTTCLEIAALVTSVAGLIIMVSAFV